MTKEQRLRLAGYSRLEIVQIMNRVHIKQGWKTKQEHLNVLLHSAARLKRKEVMRLKRKGVRGGMNAARITGWVASPNNSITKAFHTMHRIYYHSGATSRASTNSMRCYIPECLLEDAIRCYKEAYDG